MDDTEKPAAESTPWHTSKGDMYKALFDYFKHLTTLSAGSVLLIATLIEKLFKQPSKPYLVSVSVGAFMVALVLTMLAYVTWVLNYPQPSVERPSDREAHWMATFMVVGSLSFVLGVLALGAFFLFNWSSSN